MDDRNCEFSYHRRDKQHGHTQKGLPSTDTFDTRLLEYCMRHIAFLPSLKDAIIVTSVCPGMVRSDLGRQYNTNFLLGIALVVVSHTMMRATADGANIYITALGRGEEVRGEMWKDDKVIGTEADEMMRSESGKKFGDDVWEQTKGVLEGMDESGVVKELVQS